MAKVQVRVIGHPYKGVPVGQEITMSLSRSRDAIALGLVEPIDAKPLKKVAKKAVRKAPARKAITGTMNRAMRGNTSTK